MTRKGGNGMRISFNKGIKYYIFAGVLSLVTLVFGILLGISPLHIIITTVIAATILLVRIEFKDGIALFWIFLIFLAFSAGIFVLMQFTITAGIKNIPVLLFIVNILLIFLLELVVFGICGNVKVSVAVIAILSIAVGIIDYLTVQGRSLELFFSDIFAVGVALDVLGSYNFTFSALFRRSVIYSVLFIIFIFMTRFPKRNTAAKHRIATACSALAMIALLAFASASEFGVKALGVKDAYWKYNGSSYNGFYVRILRSTYATLVSRPEGYSHTRLLELIEKYRTEKANTGANVPDTGEASSSPVTDKPAVPTTSDVEITDPVTDKKSSGPNIIVVMNETFADIQAVNKWLFDNGYTESLLETDIDPLEYYHSLQNSPSVEKGWAVSSVFGGNTANSEFEFLTGHSMAFFPAGTVIYNLYLNENNGYSLVGNLSDAGYYTVGMHPENPTNWSRNKVYSYLGFDRSVFIDDFTDLTEDDYYRNHVSDSATYKKLEEIYEEFNEGSDAPFFAFVVTMMNHGGYNSQDFEYLVDIEDENDVHQAEEFLSSIKKSDEALKELIEYFSSVDEETVVVVFGDHQPSISNDYFYSEYLGDSPDSETPVLSKYIVPYLIWANFDFAENEETTDEVDLTSLNYLSLRLYDICGIEKTEYLGFITDIRKDYPVISGIGYVDRDGVFHTNDEMNAESDPLLQVYKYLQYNCIFDTDYRLQEWFSPSKKND